MENQTTKLTDEEIYNTSVIAASRSSEITTHMNVAFYTANHETPVTEYHWLQGIEQFEKLADCLGYDLVKREAS